MRHKSHNVTIIEREPYTQSLAVVNIDTSLKTIADTYQVSDTEWETLSLALDGLPTAEIATHLGCSPDAVRKRLGQVYSKFEITGKGPGKLATLRYKLQHLQPKSIPNPTITQAATISSTSVDGENIPRVSGFWGRQAELSILNQWVIKDRCPLVTVSGMVGMGKTAIGVCLTQQIKDQFDSILWCNLQDTPPLHQILPSWLQSFYQDESISVSTNLDEQLALLIQYFRQFRCLLILDQFECLFQPKQLAGNYQQYYQDYRQLLQRVGKSNHKSCLMILTQDKPLELVRMIGESLPIQTLSLTGLTTADAETLIETLLDLPIASEAIYLLVKRYSGNPLALKTAATTIRELFNGNIDQFLQHNLFLGDVLTQALQQQLQRLSNFEKQILYDFALHQSPVNPEQLQSHFSSLGNSSDILNGLESLKRRSLLETITEADKVQWTIQPMMKQYIIHQVREKMSLFIACKNANKLNKAEFLTNLGMINPDLLIEADEQIEQQFTYSQIAKHLNKMGYDKYFSGDFIVAKKYLLWALEFCPDFEKAHYNLGSTYEELEDYQLARQHYQQAAQGSGNSAIFARNNLGRLDILEGSIETAINWMNAALEISPEEKLNFSIYKNLGWAYLMKSQYNPAEKYLQKALDLDPKYSSAHYLMAKILVEKGELKAAKQYWSNALKYDRWGEKTQGLPWRLPELEGWRSMAHQYLQKPESTSS
ncbi:MAG: tetratricopeptide repeat protein [Microcoleaceae cyanobacterium]